MASLTLIGAAVAATPAEAHWHGGWHHGWGGGGAFAAGVAGLAVGAAIARSAHPHHYYAGPRPYYGYYGPACWTQWRWDPWYGNVPVRICR